MEPMTLESLIKVLQASISPVALISGVGLLLLSLTNRFGRVTDRLRELVGERRAGHANAGTAKQIEIFHRRARIVRSAISASVGCMFMASLMVLLLFGMALFHFPAHLIVLMFFAISICFLVTSLTFFLLDMRLSLDAIEEDLVSK
ncbi:MAG TPA: DUF2721 domain-containing protein [Candidatus Acidoferrum sp.]|nr:DUF2721 domain-containing protein [Candidatus Acidoferrum sp.]